MNRRQKSGVCLPSPRWNKPSRPGSMRWIRSDGSTFPSSTPFGRPSPGCCTKPPRPTISTANASFGSTLAPGGEKLSYVMNAHPKSCAVQVTTASPSHALLQAQALLNVGGRRTPCKRFRVTQEQPFVSNLRGRSHAYQYCREISCKTWMHIHKIRPSKGLSERCNPLFLLNIPCANIP